MITDSGIPRHVLTAAYERQARMRYRERHDRRLFAWLRGEVEQPDADMAQGGPVLDLPEAAE